MGVLHEHATWMKLEAVVRLFSPACTLRHVSAKTHQGLVDKTCAVACLVSDLGWHR